MTMIRVGKYTGKIYPSDYPLDKIGECCISIPGDRMEKVEEVAKRCGKKCIGECAGGCPESIKNPR